MSTKKTDVATVAGFTPGPWELSEDGCSIACICETPKAFWENLAAALHAQDFNQTPGKLPVGASYSIFDQLAKEDAANPNAGVKQAFPKGRWT